MKKKNKSTLHTESKPLLYFTDAAKSHIEKKIAQYKGGIGFRLAVKSSGCSGYRYDLSIITDIGKDHCHMQLDNKVSVYIPEDSIALLKGTKVDFVRKGLGYQQLTFDNPQAVDACGCGESFALKQEEKNG